MTGRRREDETGSSIGTVRSAPTRRGAETNSALYLHVLGRARIESFPLPASGTVVVGRSKRAEVSIDEPCLSRRHMAIHVGSRIEVEDLGSANGVHVGDRALRPGERAAVDPGTVLELGAVMLVVQRAGGERRPRRLWSHGYFEARVAEECARGERVGVRFAVVRLHAEGAEDPVVHDVLSQTLRPNDVLAAYGPGEYEVLLLDVAPSDTEAMVAEIGRRLLAAHVTARFGVACYPRDTRAPDALIGIASEGVFGARTQAGRRDEPFVGATLHAIDEVIARIARGTLPVLVLGETGVGKELVAERVHMQSPRAGKPFVRVNCAALAESIASSELFGHERGAFTSADQSKAGLLEAADGGTIFFDEVGELPLALQPKLLRVLEDRLVTRVGGTKPRLIDVRFVAATNRDLDAEVIAGRFRRDLLFRINGCSVVVPPLRARADEIDALARHFVASFARAAGRDEPPGISPEVLSALRAHSWPGNVRELRNTLERAVLLCASDTLSLEHLAMDQLSGRAVRSSEPSDAPPRRKGADTHADVLRAELAEHERRRVVDTLARCGGNQTQAAKLLGMSRGTLLARLDAYGVERPRKR
jgi:DNA-binding NtrC family response regulator